MTLRTIAPVICAYQSAKITDEIAQTYAIALADIDQTALAAAVLKCLRTKKFFPAIMEIREEVDNLTAIAIGQVVKSPDEAWNEVQKQMQEAFIYKKPVFSTPEIEKAALSMGWIGLCETPTEQIGTARAQFLRMYESVCNRKRENKINNDVLQIMGSGNKTAELVGKVIKPLP